MISGIADPEAPPPLGEIIKARQSMLGVFLLVNFIKKRICGIRYEKMKGVNFHSILFHCKRYLRGYLLNPGRHLGMVCIRNRAVD